jgi:hypothetical protein
MPDDIGLVDDTDCPSVLVAYDEKSDMWIGEGGGR